MSETKPRRPARTKTAATAARPRKVAAKTAAPKAPRKSPVRVKPKAAKAGKGRGLLDIVLAALEDMKAQNVTVLDVRELTTVTDTIVIASGTSDRHVKSLASNVMQKSAEAGHRALGREGERDGEWVLVDLQDVIVHLMLPRVREFYGLEKLWDVRSADRT
jgi:ribosome-associated protein